MSDNVKQVITPDLGIDHPVPVAEIFVRVGDRVKKEDPLLSLESEKAVMDIPSPFEGEIREILVAEGDDIETGTPLLTMDVMADSSEPEEEIRDEPSPPSEPEEKPVDRAVPEESDRQEPTERPRESSSSGLSHASPSVRLYARELGVDPARVNGTGPKGRVRREDVQAFVKESLARGRSRSGTATGGGLPPAPYTDPAKFGPVERVNLTGIQKISGSRLHASWVNIPHVTHFIKTDVTDLESWRNALNGREKGDRKYTLLAFAVKALAAVVTEYPRFNAVLDPEGESLILRKYVNIGIAVDTPKGLLVPVIPGADEKGLGRIADDIVSLAAKGREGKLSPKDLEGGGISVSNLGFAGNRAVRDSSFTPVINPPEVAILGLSRSDWEPVWNGEEFKPRLMLPLSLSYDHRVIDGAMAARFAARLGEMLSDMKETLL